MSIISSTGIHGPRPITHPDSDGKPMADNTKQYQWIQLIQSNLAELFADRPDVFVAGDLLWYPNKESEESAAPDVMLAFGRPKGHRGSYKQWLEGDVPATVAFEILSPCNDTEEMAKKFYFYDEYGVEEYYIYNPDTNKLEIFVRGLATFRQIHDIASYRSRRLGIRFEMTQPEMTIYGPDGKRFIDLTESKAETRDERAQKEEARRQGAEDKRRADEEKRRADEEKLRADEAERQTGEEKRRADDEKRRADDEKRRADDEKLRGDEARRQSDDDKRRADEEKRRADAAVALAARLMELSRKARRGQASAEELAELERLEDESALS
jgi:Uma2 family endonuclease